MPKRHRRLCGTRCRLGVAKRKMRAGKADQNVGEVGRPVLVQRRKRCVSLLQGFERPFLLAVGEQRRAEAQQHRREPNRQRLRGEEVGTSAQQRQRLGVPARALRSMPSRPLTKAVS